MCLNPSQEQLKQLPLAYGINELCFSVLKNPLVPKGKNVIKTLVESTVMLILEGIEYLGEEKLRIEDYEDLKRIISRRYADGGPVFIEIFSLEEFAFVPFLCVQQLEKVSALNVSKNGYSQKLHYLPIGVLPRLIRSNTYTLQSSCYYWKVPRWYYLILMELLQSLI